MPNAIAGSARSRKLIWISYFHFKFMLKNVEDLQHSSTWIWTSYFHSKSMSFMSSYVESTLNIKLLTILGLVGQHEILVVNMKFPSEHCPNSGNACISIGFQGFWEDVRLRGGRGALQKSSSDLTHINQWSSAILRASSKPWKCMHSHRFSRFLGWCKVAWW